MAIIIDGRRRILGDVTAELVRLETLLSDLRHLAAGNVPAERNLQAAPLLEDWRVTPIPAAALTGVVDGHPDIGDGRAAVTTLLTVFAPDLGWARTETRLYRLGTGHLAQGRLQ